MNTAKCPPSIVMTAFAGARMESTNERARLVGVVKPRMWLLAPIAPGLALRHPEVFGDRFAFMGDGLLSAAERGAAIRDFERNLRLRLIGARVGLLRSDR